METTTEETRTCPFCKEDIKLEAIKCKHCHSRVAPDRPDHGGVCPFCKEDVKPEAIRCKHCGSQIGDTADTTTQSCSCSGPRLALRRPITDIYGQDCFYNCYDNCRAFGGSNEQCHGICEAVCGISMPPQLSVLYERLTSRQRR